MTNQNAVVVGFDFPFIRDVIYRLEKNNVIEIKKWFISSDTDDEEIKLKNAVHWRYLIEGDIQCNYEYNIPDDIYINLRNNFYTYLDQIVRESYFENRAAYENLNVINVFIHYFYDLLIKNKIDIIIFSDAPHGAYACILYDIAKLLNVKTLICFPCYMREKFLVCWDLDDIGYYKLNVNFSLETEGNNNIVDGNFEKAVFWEPKKNFSIKKLIDDRKASFKDYSYKYDNLFDWITRHIIKSLNRSYQKYLYNFNYKRLFKDKINDNEKFVYFPIHLQPEMTTSTLGGIYNDQILVIEKIRKIIPDDWYIYVKENPLQTYQWRDKYFFLRLQGFKNIRFMSKETNTYELINKSQFVATITGTAGFEAISGGKPALTFGRAWYRCLPGVTVYNDKVQLSDIMKTFTVEEVKKGFDKLSENFIEGVIAEEVYKYQEIDLEKNKEMIYNCLKIVITSENKNMNILEYSKES